MSGCPSKKIFDKNTKLHKAVEVREKLKQWFFFIIFTQFFCNKLLWVACLRFFSPSQIFAVTLALIIVQSCATSRSICIEPSYQSQLSDSLLDGRQQNYESCDNCFGTTFVPRYIQGLHNSCPNKWLPTKEDTWQEYRTISKVYETAVQMGGYQAKEKFSKKSDIVFL